MGKKILIDMAERGRNGGKARAAKMNPAQRKRAARAAVNSRWKKYRLENGIPEPPSKGRRGRKAAA